MLIYLCLMILLLDSASKQVIGLVFFLFIEVAVKLPYHTHADVMLIY